jgi:hypothetical protein
MVISLCALQAFKQEVAWATHLGLHAVMLPAPRFHSTNYSHVINHVASNLSYMQAWVKIPLVAPEVLLQVSGQDPLAGREANFQLFSDRD